MSSRASYDRGMARRKRTELNITDPRALRALAHPARQSLITELYSGEVLTATEAADIVDLSPSATSYHLRALEKFGIVIRGDASGDARQRPWRAAADSLSVRPETYRAAGLDASSSSFTGWLADLDAGLARAGRAIADGHDDVGHTSHSRLWLTPTEMVELRDRLIDLVDEYKNRTRADHPEMARPWDTYHAVLPAEEVAEQ